MIDAVSHRGPNGEDVLVDGPAGIAHRRLAIIDLSAAGSQPMVSADGRYVLSYNGEIYNFQELRAELQAKGYVFRSRTDSEVLLYAWAAWGKASLLRFNGMFAFAIWDRQRKELVLARDRYGIKPLYWLQQRKVFLFGSESKSILRHPAANAGVDLEALLEYMTFQNFFTNRTLHKDVKLLPPGTLMVIAQETGSVSFERYWDFEFTEPDAPATMDEYSEEFDALFRQAVQRQLVSDVPVGSYLSGGVDSGSITALAASQIKDMRSFTVGFDLHSASGLELAMDERVAAERMSYLFKTEHYEMVLKAGDMERAMPRIVRHIEEPRVGQSYPNYYAAQLASKFGPVVLAGTGGDELFGGYPWRYYRAAVNDDFEHYIDKYYLYWQRLVSNTEIRTLFAPVWNDVKHVWTRDIFRDVFSKKPERLNRPEDYVNQSLYFEAKTFLHGLLVVEDKLSMAHGLETRVPFLDNDLVDFAMRLPVSMKLGNLDQIKRINENEPGSKVQAFYERTRDGKILLRNAMRRYVPDDISSGEKRGFSAPDASWFRGDSLNYVRDRLFRPNAKIYDILDRKTVTELVDTHLEGRSNRRLLLWSLLYIEEWLSLDFSGASAMPRQQVV